MHGHEQHVLTIEAGKAERQYWTDLWRYRELFLFLAWRDILVRYKQTVLGVAWSLLRPVISMVVLAIVFGMVARLPSPGVPYPLLVFCAMLPWQFFSNAISAASESLIANRNMVSKVYFPRLIVPSSSVLVSLVDFLVALVVLGGLLAWYGFLPGWNVLWALPFLLLSCVIALGTGYWLAALNVKYRDFRYVVPFIVQFGMYASPVAYASSLLPDPWRFWFSLNPMVGVIDGFRWAVLGGVHELRLDSLLLSVGIGGLLLASGVWYFRRTERTFADVI